MAEQSAIPSQQLFTKQSWLSALLKDTSVITGIRTHTLPLTTPELGSDERKPLGHDTPRYFEYVRLVLGRERENPS